MRVRATRTASRPRSTASTSTTPARSSIAVGKPSNRAAGGRADLPPARGVVCEVPSSCARQTSRLDQDSLCPSFLYMSSEQAQETRRLNKDEVGRSRWGMPLVLILTRSRTSSTPGADIVQIDEPYMQSRAPTRPAASVSRWSTGCSGAVTGKTAPLLSRPPRRGAGPSAPARLLVPCQLEKGASSVRQVSIETAQSKSRLRRPGGLPARNIPASSTCRPTRSRARAVTWPARIRRGLATFPPSGYRRTRLRDEIPAARRRLRKAGGDGRAAAIVRREITGGSTRRSLPGAPGCPV